jgi:hypothetical protein
MWMLFTGIYTLSATAPSVDEPVTGYTVWFKSPWGEKVVPNMIYGADTLPMVYHTENTHCGWFSYTFTADQLMASMPVYFQRPVTGLTYPAAIPRLMLLPYFP